eukprot:3939191-Rhodomonas_salina.1
MQRRVVKKWTTRYLAVVGDGISGRNAKILYFDEKARKVLSAKPDGESLAHSESDASCGGPALHLQPVSLQKFRGSPRKVHKPIRLFEILILPPPPAYLLGFVVLDRSTIEGESPSVGNSKSKFFRTSSSESQSRTVVRVTEQESKKTYSFGFVVCPLPCIVLLIAPPFLKPSAAEMPAHRLIAPTYLSRGTQGDDHRRAWEQAFFDAAYPGWMGTSRPTSNATRAPAPVQLDNSVGFKMDLNHESDALMPSRSEEPPIPSSVPGSDFSASFSNFRAAHLPAAQTRGLPEAQAPDSEPERDRDSDSHSESGDDSERMGEERHLAAEGGKKGSASLPASTLRLKLQPPPSGNATPDDASHGRGEDLEPAGRRLSRRAESDRVLGLTDRDRHKPASNRRKSSIFSFFSSRRNSTGAKNSDAGSPPGGTLRDAD